jgi:hypothetical protein
MYICTGVADTWYMKVTVICTLWLTDSSWSTRLYNLANQEESLLVDKGKTSPARGFLKKY